MLVESLWRLIMASERRYLVCRDKEDGTREYMDANGDMGDREDAHVEEWSTARHFSPGFDLYVVPLRPRDAPATGLRAANEILRAELADVRAELSSRKEDCMNDVCNRQLADERDAALYAKRLLHEALAFARVKLATLRAVHESVALERDGLEKDVATLTEALAASRAGHEKTRAELDIARSDRELWKGRVEGMRRAVGEMPPCGATHPGGSPRRCEIAAGHPGMHWDRGGLWPVGETTGGPDVWDNVPDGEGEHR
jgi:hypothetical protein